MSVAAMPPEPRQGVADQDHAEELAHQWLRDRGITSRETLWCSTLASRATVWVLALRRAGESTRHAEDWLKRATAEVKLRVLRHQMQSPLLSRDERAELVWRHNLFDYTHLPVEMTRPPVGWLEDPVATP